MVVRKIRKVSQRRGIDKTTVEWQWRRDSCLEGCFELRKEKSSFQALNNTVPIKHFRKICGVPVWFVDLLKVGHL